MEPSIKDNKAPQTPLRKAANGISWALALPEFNPKRWLTGGAYERGKVISTAWENVKTVWLPKKKSEYRTETFKEACERLNVTEEQLVRRRQEFVFSSRSSYLCGVGVLLFSAYSAFHGNQVGGFGGLWFTLVAFVFGFVQAYHAWKIANRSLAPITEFFRATEAWVV